MGSTVKFGAYLDDKVSTGLDRIRDKFDQLGGKGAGATAFGVGGAAAIAKGFSLIGDAVDSVTGLLGDAKRAYEEDQASQMQLDAALKANVAGYNGNKDAIEELLTAREKLGFSDDDQRKSLSLLVAATHDSSKALAIQRTAMDLARLKGIDLQTASEALIKVEGGHYRALQALGIKIKANATETEALAAVQAVAQGQAEAYANSAEGKQAAAQQVVAEAMEKVGKVVSILATTVLPPLADAFSSLVDIISMATDAVGTLGEHMDVVGPIVAALAAVLTVVGIPALISFGIAAAAAMLPLLPLIAVVGVIAGAVVLLGKAWDLATGSTAEAAKAQHDYMMAMSNDAVAFAKTTQGMADDVRESNRIARQSIQGVGTASTDAADAMEAATKRMITAGDLVKSAILADGKALIDGYYDPLIAHDKLVANQAEITKNKRILASATATNAEKNDARVALHQLDKDNVQYLEDLASAGGSGSKLVQVAMSDYLNKLATAHGKERTAINAEIIRVERLAAIAFEASQKVAHIGDPNYIDTSHGRASGGSVYPGQTYTVGEQGPETLVMGGAGGYVIPNGGRSSRGGGQVIHSHVYLNGREIAQAVDEVSYYDLASQAATAGRV